MANDNQTALGMSIQRKKDRVKELEKSDNTAYNRIEIEFLNYEITEDEKLLAVDRDEIELAYNTGRNDSRSEIPEENDRTATTYFDQRFGS